MDKWTEIRTALHVARLGTVSAAADEMGVHRATVNRHVDQIEEELGARIFIRHSKGYALTELGENLLQVAQKTEEMLNDFSAQAKGKTSQIDGEIKITTLPPFAAVLMPPLAEFRSRNPNCRALIIASENLERLEFGDAHIALRAGPKPDHPDYVVKLYRRIRLTLCAHDRYIARKGLPSGMDDLSSHEFVAPTQNQRRLPFIQWMDENVSPTQITASSEHEFVVREAVFAGLGLGFLSDLAIANRTDVHPVPGQRDEWFVPLWLVTHVDLHRTEKVQAMLRCIEQHRLSDGFRV